MYTIKDTALIDNDTIAVLYECELGLNRTEVLSTTVMNVNPKDWDAAVKDGKVREIAEKYLDDPIVQRLSEPLFED